MATNPKTGYRKKSVSGVIRCQVAERYGCPPGGTLSVQCAYCPKRGLITWFRRRNGEPATWVRFGLEMDHVVPESAGGPTVAENIVLACQRCNRKKGARREWPGSVR